MKIFFWLLVVANAILFTSMKSGMFDRVAPSTLVPLHPEKVMLIAVEPAKSSPVVASQSALVFASGAVPAPSSAQISPDACYEWGEFSGLALEQTKMSLGLLSLAGKLSQREVERVIGFWVYIAPLNNKLEIRQKLLQLKQHGVTDYFVVQGGGEWQNAISLGLFKNRDPAQSFLRVLNNKGVSSAQVGEYTGKSRAVVFVIKGVDSTLFARLTELQKEFPASELKMVQCY